MNLIIAPEGSNCCGQACVAMAAGVSLDRAIEAVGHKKQRGTRTKEIIAALHSLGIKTAAKVRPMSRTKPVLPKRAMVSICTNKVGREYKLGHWLLYWDGVMYDPRGTWPEGYRDWVITSFLEIY